VPSRAQSWLAALPRQEITLRTLRWIFLAGEPLLGALVDRWRDAFPESGGIVNLYGATETTMVKFFYIVPVNRSPVTHPVGRPLPYTQGLVLNEGGMLCGINEPGEIVLRTPFRTKGYINASLENQKRFVRNPFRH